MSKQEEIVAQNDLGEVRPCDCGGVNLTMGPVTLHFAADEVEELYELAAAGLGMVTRPGDANVTPIRRVGKGKVAGSLH